MYFSKVTTLSLIGAAVSAPLNRIAKRDTASDVTDALVALKGTLAPQLTALTDHFNAADKDSDLDTYHAIFDDINAIGDSIDDLQSQFDDLDTQDDADIGPATDAATAVLTDVFNAFRPITQHIDDDEGFDLVTYGTMNGLGLQIGGTINLASVRLGGGLNDAVTANLGDFADVAEQIPGVGIAVDLDGDDRKKRSILARRAAVNKRDVVGDITSAFTTLQSDVAGDLDTLAAAWKDADQSSDLKTWQAISKAIWAVDAKVTTAADAIAKLGQQEGAAADGIIKAAVAAYTPIFNTFAPIAEKIEADNGFDTLTYGSMSSLSAKMLSALQTSDYHITGSAVVDGAASAFADVKVTIKAFPALDTALF